MTDSESGTDGQAIYTHATVIVPDGDSVDLHLKAWSHERGFLWELRRLFISLQLPMKHGMCRFMRQERPVWIADLVRCSFQPSERHFVESRRMHVHHKRPMDEHVHDEVAVSTGCMMVILLRMAESRRSRKVRTMSKAVLEVFVSLLLGSSAKDFATLMPPDGCTQRCDIGVPQGDDDADGDEPHGACVHLRMLGHKMRRLDVNGVPPHVFLVGLAQQLFAEGVECGACSQWCSDLLRRLADAMDHGNFASKWSTDAKKHGLLPGGQKKRRIDEDLRKQVSVDVVAAGLTSSAGRWCQTTGELSQQLGDTFDNRSCREYLASGAMSMWGHRFYSIAFDASRIGQPAVDANIYLLWSMDGGYGMWLAPQALTESTSG